MFTGNREGYFLAFDARDGKLLWKASFKGKDEKSLVICGIEPQTPLANELNAERFVEDLFNKLTKEIAVKNDYQQVLVSISEATLSNRRENIKLAIEKLIAGKPLISQAVQTTFPRNARFSITKLKLWTEVHSGQDKNDQDKDITNITPVSAAKLSDVPAIAEKMLEVFAIGYGFPDRRTFRKIHGMSKEEFFAQYFRRLVKSKQLLLVKNKKREIVAFLDYWLLDESCKDRVKNKLAGKGIVPENITSGRHVYIQSTYVNSALQRNKVNLRIISDMQQFILRQHPDVISICAHRQGKWHEVRIKRDKEQPASSPVASTDGGTNFILPQTKALSYSINGLWIDSGFGYIYNADVSIDKRSGLITLTIKEDLDEDESCFDRYTNIHTKVVEIMQKMGYQIIRKNTGRLNEYDNPVFAYYVINLEDVDFTAASSPVANMNIYEANRQCQAQPQELANEDVSFGKLLKKLKIESTPSTIIFSFKKWPFSKPEILELPKGISQQEIYFRIRHLLEKGWWADTKNDLHYNTAFYRVILRKNIFDPLFNPLTRTGLLLSLIAHKKKLNQYRIRVWSAGASTGAELRTLIWLINQALEVSEEDKGRWKLEFYGTDVNKFVLNVASLFNGPDMKFDENTGRYEAVQVDVSQAEINYLVLDHNSENDLEKWLSWQKAKGGFDIVFQNSTPASFPYIEKIKGIITAGGFYGNTDRLFVKDLPDLSTIHAITAQKMFNAAKLYANGPYNEPYISIAFEKLGNIIFRIAMA